MTNFVGSGIATMFEKARRAIAGGAPANGPTGSRLPKSWRVGDKTGTGDHGATNDIAVAWPLDRAPFIVTAYYAESSASADERSAVLAEVARIVAPG